jgi:hypothetical protein
MINGGQVLRAALPDQPRPFREQGTPTPGGAATPASTATPDVHATPTVEP